MSTIERTRHRTPIDRPRPRRGLASRLTGPGWVIMTLACVYIAVAMSRYLTFDPDVYFPEQLENYLRLEFALGVHVLCGMLALLIGPFQFVRRLRRRFVRVHRSLRRGLRRECDRARRDGSDPGSDGLHRSGGVGGLHAAGPGHAVHDLDGAADGPGRPLRRAPALDDPQLLPDHGRGDAAGVGSRSTSGSPGSDSSTSPSRPRTPRSPGCAGCRTC